MSTLGNTLLGLFIFIQISSAGFIQLGEVYEKSFSVVFGPFGFVISFGG